MERQERGRRGEGGGVWCGRGSGRGWGEGVGVDWVVWGGGGEEVGHCGAMVEVCRGGWLCGCVCVEMREWWWWCLERGKVGRREGGGGYMWMICVVVNVYGG